jgi:hypothetical protein
MASRIPIRWRLTLWYAGLLALVIMLLSLTLYFGLRQLLYSSLDDALHQQAALVAATIDVVDGVPHLPASNTHNRPKAHTLSVSPINPVRRWMGQVPFAAGCRRTALISAWRCPEGSRCGG